MNFLKLSPRAQNLRRSLVFSPKYFNALLWAIAALVVLSTVYVTLAFHSAVPYWDMWDGYLGWYLRFTSGETVSLFGQHNEHRILLSRLLFYVDLTYFHGTGLVLVAVHLLFCAWIFSLLARFAHLRGAGASDAPAHLLVYPFLLIFSFSWLQSQNITWAFQSQFLLAYAIPLAAMLQLYYAATLETAPVRAFVLAVFWGVLSAATMANGILVLPILAFAALLLGLGVWRFAVLVVAAVVVISAYMTGYHAPDGHGSVGETLRNDPLRMIVYAAAYIGSPAKYLIGHSTKVAMAVGLVFFALFLRGLWGLFKPTADRALKIVLLGFLGYLWVTAFVTAGGRLVFGLDQATSGRYLTPALMAWGITLVLFLPALARRKPAAVVVPALVIGLAFLSDQPFKKSEIRAENVLRMRAALALELGVRDAAAYGAIFPVQETLISLAEAARADNLTVFGVEPVVGARARLGTIVEPSAQACLFGLDEVAEIVGDTAYLRVRGWLHDPLGDDKVLIIDAQNQVVGQAVPGLTRRDVSNAVAGTGDYDGFEGYMRKGVGPVRLLGAGCASAPVTP